MRASSRALTASSIVSLCHGRANDVVDALTVADTCDVGREVGVGGELRLAAAHQLRAAPIRGRSEYRCTTSCPSAVQ